MACLAGPVVVCALAVEPKFYERFHPKLARLRDSKMLQAHQREKFLQALSAQAGLKWAIALCDVKTIDEVNIYQASRIAMREAIHKVLGESLEVRNGRLLPLSSNRKPIVLVDGNKVIHEMPLPQKTIVGGDRKIWAIAAASILAKVHRDRLMTEYASRYPNYAFEKHKGYPTRLHRTRLAEFGPCPLHRRSFHGTLDELPL